MTGVDVAIVNYNTCSLLRDCLQSVFADHPGQVIVVDNASTDGSQDMVKNEFPTCHLIANETNGGYSKAANQAIRASIGTYILLLNSDTQIPPGTLQALSRYLDLHPNVGIAGPRIRSADGQLQPSCFPFPTLVFLFLQYTGLYQLIRRIPLVREISPRTWSHTRPRTVPWLLGAALAIRQEAYNAVNGFDPGYYMYFEETDLCYRMWQKAWQIHFTPAAEIVHLGGASTRQRQTEMVIQFYLSLLHFYRLHYTPYHTSGMVVLVRVASLARWLRDQVDFWMTRDSQRKEMLLNNLAAWRTLVLTRWEERKNG